MKITFIKGSLYRFGFSKKQFQIFVTEIIYLSRKLKQIFLLRYDTVSCLDLSRCYESVLDKFYVKLDNFSQILISFTKSLPIIFNKWIY